MASLFRFPGVTIEADVTQTVAVRASDGKFYRVSIQDIIDLAETEGVSIPSINDDGTDVVVDANLEVTGTLTLGGLPTADPLADGAVWLDSGVLTISAGA